MSEIEKLARDICWAEFITKPKKQTKAAYWRAVHPDKQAEYIRDAEWVVFIAKQLKPIRILSLVDFRSKGVRERRPSHDLPQVQPDTEADGCATRRARLAEPPSRTGGHVGPLEGRRRRHMDHAVDQAHPLQASGAREGEAMMTSYEQGYRDGLKAAAGIMENL